MAVNEERLVEAMASNAEAARAARERIDRLRSSGLVDADVLDEEVERVDAAKRSRGRLWIRHAIAVGIGIAQVAPAVAIEVALLRIGEVRTDVLVVGNAVAIAIARPGCRRLDSA